MEPTSWMNERNPSWSFSNWRSILGCTCPSWYMIWRQPPIGWMKFWCLLWRQNSTAVKSTFNHIMCLFDRPSQSKWMQLVTRRQCSSQSFLPFKSMFIRRETTTKTLKAHSALDWAGNQTRKTPGEKEEWLCGASDAPHLSNVSRAQRQPDVSQSRQSKNLYDSNLLIFRWNPIRFSNSKKHLDLMMARVIETASFRKFSSKWRSLNGTCRLLRRESNSFEVPCPAVRREVLASRPCHGQTSKIIDVERWDNISRNYSS